MVFQFSTKKIVVFQPYDVVGSIQDRSLEVAKYVRQIGIDTVFVVPRNDGYFSRKAKENGFKVYKVSIRRPPYTRTAIDYLILLVWAFGIIREIFLAYQILKREVPDLIQINGFVCIQEAFAAILYQRRISIWNLIGTTYPRFLILCFSFLIRLQKKRIFVSRRLIPYYFGYASDVVIREPVNIDKFKPIKLETPHPLIPIELDPSTKLIGFVGSISPVKGLEYLIPAFSKVMAKMPSTKLLIIGGKLESQISYYRKIVMLVSQYNLDNSVLFLGHISHNELPSLLNQLDVFVSSSLYEGTPVSILEAMACEIPVVATEVGGVPDQVVNDLTGFLVPPRDVDALSNALVNMLNDQELREKMGFEGRKRIEGLYSLKGCLAAYRREYALLLSNS